MGRMLIALCTVGSLALFAAPADALAQDKVKLNIHVVHVSNQGNVVDPPSLVAMKESFAKEGLQFSSYKQLSTQTVELVGNKASDISLPNGKKASLQLQKVDQGVAVVDLTVAPLKTTIRLGREGSVSQAAGKYQGGQLVLVVSPITEKAE